MAKIIDPDDLNVGTELFLDTSAKTFTLSAQGNLSSDGVTMQALYSKFVDLWNTSAYNIYPMPCYAIDARSGQFQFGTDGQNFNGWKPANIGTRNFIRDGAWSEFSAAGTLNRQYLGVITLGSVGSGDQLYYQRETGGSAINFVYTGPVNEAVQIYGDASNGSFDTRTYFKVFCRIQGKTYSESTLSDIGETGTGAYKLAFPISNSTDVKITHTDNDIDTTSPYTEMTVTYYGTDQTRNIGGSNYNFRRIIDNGTGVGTAEQVYEWAQRQLRKNSDIDAGAGTVIGNTADLLLEFVGDRLDTKLGVFIDDYNSNDVNRIRFQDQTAVYRTFPFTAAGTINFNSFLVGAGSRYDMYFTTLPGANNDWGESGAVQVQNASSVPIGGTVSSSSISFTFAYDSNVQGGRTAATDADVVIIASRPGSGKVTKATGTITRSTGLSFTVTAEQDRAYSNP